MATNARLFFLDSHSHSPVHIQQGRPLQIAVGQSVLSSHRASQFFWKGDFRFNLVIWVRRKSSDGMYWHHSEGLRSVRHAQGCYRLQVPPPATNDWFSRRMTCVTASGQLDRPRGITMSTIVNASDEKASSRFQPPSLRSQRLSAKKQKKSWNITLMPLLLNNRRINDRAEMFT